MLRIYTADRRWRRSATNIQISVDTKWLFFHCHPSLDVWNNFWWCSHRWAWCWVACLRIHNTHSNTGYREYAILYSLLVTRYSRGSQNTVHVIKIRGIYTIDECSFIYSSVFTTRTQWRTIRYILVVACCLFAQERLSIWRFVDRIISAVLPYQSTVYNM
jgi:hypothetical protein